MTCGHNFMTLELQHRRDELEYLVFIIDNQDPHDASFRSLSGVVPELVTATRSSPRES